MIADVRLLLLLVLSAMLINLRYGLLALVEVSLRGHARWNDGWVPDTLQAAPVHWCCSGRLEDESRGTRHFAEGLHVRVVAVPRRSSRAQHVTVAQADGVLAMVSPVLIGAHAAVVAVAATSV